MRQQRHHHLARHVDEDRVRAAIAQAESHTTGKIHVTLSHHFPGPTLGGAERAFRELALDKTPDRNGVLFFVVPSRRQFAVVGDAGIHEKVGQEFWERIAAAVGEKIASGDLTEGLLHGIEEAASELAAHFPRAAQT